MQHFFSIIIVTWNGLDHLKTFLPSVLDTTYDKFEVIIADNASTDGTKEWINEYAPECRIVIFDRNYGYCGGNNRAVEFAKGDILLFLNNDVHVAPDWLDHLNRSFQQSETGVVQPKLRSHHQPDYFEYAGAAGGMIDWLGYPFCRGRLFETVEKDTGQYNDESKIFWASGAALAIRKEIFNNLGGFNEDFEFHMEEIDLCWRVWHSGLQVCYQPKSVVYHYGGGSLPMESPRKVYYNYRNSLLMLTINLESHRWLKVFLRLCLDGVAGVRSLLQFRPAETWAIIKAHFGFYKRLPSAIRRRAQLKKVFRRTPDMSPPVYDKLIIVERFLRRKRYYSDLDNID
ncbi:glycosyltransferase family 2 protein [Rhodohalobacter sp. 8-1]|uniref:glycosyltransferase family 2 protein n=1 Tax=Rhodohalobacter sp. 8-1 TaxID=3131972 RepID=UPI0030EE77C4